MGFFKKIFGSKKGEETNASIKKEEVKGSAEKYIQKFSSEPYNFKTITLPELLKKNDELYNLYTNASDGYLVKNFLSEKEVDTIMANFDKVLNDNPAYTAVGFTYPTVFAEFSNRIKENTEEEKQALISAYFDKNLIFRDTFVQEFGVDVKGKLEEMFNAISGGRGMVVADGMGGMGSYPFATFRYLTPEKGLMSVHCGNYFGKTFEKFYEDLTRKVAVTNQMSFFIMLQQPEEGGELSLFNFRWKDGQTKMSPSEDNEIIQPDGTKMNVNTNPNIMKDKIAPQKGDLIIFQGGNIWHKVEPVKGKMPRITLGGFMGISVNKDKFYYWS
jgi:hypothetical protein